MAFSGEPGIVKRLGAGLMKMLGKNNEYRYDYNPDDQTYTQISGPGMKKGGVVKSSASKRADVV